MQELYSRIVTFVKSNKLISSIGGLGFVCLFIGCFFLSSVSSDSSVQFASGTTNQKISGSKTLGGKDVVVDVAGGVQKPGVYILHSGARVKDAVIAAGGFASSVDRVRVAQTVNLAMSLIDGAKLYIPVSGEQMMTSGGVLGESSQLVNINQANASDLDGLPGVGKVTAEKIIANRPYGSLQELVDKKVVGASLYTKIKEKLSLY